MHEYTYMVNRSVDAVETASITVEAESEDEAMDKVDELLAEGNVNWDVASWEPCEEDPPILTDVDGEHVDH